MFRKQRIKPWSLSATVTLRTTGGIAGILTRPLASGMIWIYCYRNVHDLHVIVDMQDVKAKKNQKKQLMQ